MRTTLNIDDQLLIAAKHRAAEQGVTLAGVVEAALRQVCAKSIEVVKTTKLFTVSGAGLKPGVALDNSRSLLDIMDDMP